MNRSDFQRLASQRLKEARLLLRSKQPDSAYYLTGLVVECALKACIAKRTEKHDFPDKKIVERSWSHELTQLIEIAGLKTVLDSERKARPHLDTNWSIVKDWKNESRYGHFTLQDAKELYGAVVARRNGILTWIGRHW